MDWRIQHHKRSQLGQILLRKRLISEHQLSEAIRHQDRTGQRLGEILSEWKLTTERQIHGAMRRQRNARLAGAVAAALLGPLHAYAAVLATPAEQGEAQPPAPVRASAGLRPLDDDEMRATSAQDLDEDDRLRAQLAQAQQQLQYLNQQAGPAAALTGVAHLASGDGVQTLHELARMLNPLSALLEAQVSMTDVVYDPASSSAVVNKDGSITLRLPSTIGRLSFRNIRVSGDTHGASFGSIDISRIDLRGTTITISGH